MVGLQIKFNFNFNSERKGREHHLSPIGDTTKNVDGFWATKSNQNQIEFELQSRSKLKSTSVTRVQNLTITKPTTALAIAIITNVDPRISGVVAVQRAISTPNSPPKPSPASKPAVTARARIIADTPRQPTTLRRPPS